MFPDLFSIGPLTLHTYGLLVATGLITGILITIRLGRPQGVTPQQVTDMSFLMILSGIIGSRLAYILMNFTYYRAHLLDIIKLWQGGLVFSGALIAVVLVMVWYTRRHKLNLWQIGDLWSPAVAIGQGIGRIGCFMAGCCYGKPTDHFWGITFTNPRSIAPLNIPIHPTQLYSSFANLVIFIVLIVLSGKKKFEGQVLVWFLILHSTARLLIERFRGDDRGMIFGNEWTVTQLLTTIILIAAVITLFILKSRSERDIPDNGDEKN